MLRFVPFCALLFATACSGVETGAPAQLEYDDQTGRLTKVVFDANKNGRNESTSFMDGTRIVRVELDFDENGKIERWDFYNDDRSLQKVGFASGNDGVMDSQAFYTADGRVERIEVSTDRDGRFNRLEFYDEREHLVRSEEDTNGDGRPDKWDTYAAVTNPRPDLPGYTVTTSAFDEAGAGHPTRRIVFGPGGAIDHVEVDPDGDGRFRRLTPASGLAP